MEGDAADASITGRAIWVGEVENEMFLAYPYRTSLSRPEYYRPASIPAADNHHLPLRASAPAVAQMLRTLEVILLSYSSQAQAQA
jgi:hypothetical protein